MAITGPESTGKSKLAEQLASHFNTVWVPEYSREYLRELNRSYGYDDILSIAKGQFEDEERMAAQATGLLFCDTDFIVNKIWCIDKFGKCHSWILDMIGQQHYDLYLLCNTDLPWEPDPLRENPEDRERLFGLYKTELEERKLPYAIIGGTGKERLENAIRVVQNLRST
ncbi:MAG: AAA family ATPase [Bacteroidetes bacterium]|nr:AAA family ATPase [Bacteroidota bacterium]